MDNTTSILLSQAIGLQKQIELKLRTTEGFNMLRMSYTHTFTVSVQLRVDEMDNVLLQSLQVTSPNGDTSSVTFSNVRLPYTVSLFHFEFTPSSTVVISKKIYQTPDTVKRNPRPVPYGSASGASRRLFGSESDDDDDWMNDDDDENNNDALHPVHLRF